MADGACDAELEVLKAQLLTLSSTVATQGQWIERLLAGSIVVVDPHGCGLFRSIQEAIRRCHSGDTIVVREGVYDEALVMDKEGLTVKGAGEGVVVENRSEACAATFTAAGTLVGLTLRQHHRHFACVRFEAGAGVLEDCDVTSANLSCVVVAADARPCVRRCKVHGSQQYGVAVKPGARPTLEHNSVFGNCQPNIVIEAGADPLIRYNDIHGSKQNGIWVHTRGKGHIAYNDIYENAYSNVDIMEEGDPLVEHNCIHHSLKCGVCVAEKGLGTIQDNDIYSNEYSNIGVLPGAAPKVYRNLIHNSKQHGVFIKSKGGGRIEDNHIYANMLANIKIEDGAEVEHRNNQNPKLRPV